MIPREVIEEIKNRLDIVEIISEYVNLERVGGNYRALCPFHVETRPSFYVNPKLQLYHCFGCGAKGDVIKFVQDMENISFSEALEKLAKRAGVDLTPYVSGRSGYSIYITFLEELKKEYQKALRRSEEAREYLKSRGISMEDAERFEIGFSPMGSDLPLRVAKKLGVEEKNLARFGVVFKTSRGYRDVFEGRIVFPIKNDSGSTVAFGGRLIGDGEPKYLNSRDTKYFSKSRILFLLDRAKKFIKNNDLVIITEGYMDALAFHRAGFENTVAVLGTSLSGYHVSRLSGLTLNAVLAFDSDESGERATLRSLDILLERGFEVLVVDFSPWKDADEVYRDRGSKGLEEVLERAVRYEEYIAGVMARRFNLSVPGGKEKYVRAVGRWVERLRSCGKTAGARELVKIAAKISSMSEMEFERHLSSRTVRRDEGVEAFGPEEEIVYIYINHEEFREDILKKLEDFKDIISERLREFLELVGSGDLNSSLEKLSKNTGDWIFKILRDIPPPSDPKKALDEVFERLELVRLSRRLEEIDRRLSDVVDDDERKVLMSARMDLVRRMKGLQRR